MIDIKIYLIGIGMGDISTMTGKAKEITEKADIVIGAERMTEFVDKSKTVFYSYKAEEIKEYLKDKSVEIVAILLSGDVGFYSGAKKLLAALKEYETELVCGISSVVYFCSKLKMSWEDVKLLSIHGKKQNIIQYISCYKKVFSLLSGNESIREICQKLCYYGMGDVTLHIGQRLSYEDEKIITVKAEDIKEFEFESLVVVLAENFNAKYNMGCIEDSEFIRGDVPMTKSEVRSLSIAKLGLFYNSVLYDIGVGTGSVSVEAARKLIDGTVYAIEYNEKAIELIEQNKRKFVVDNVNIVKGKAPEVLNELPIPTHVFIGGSSGNMRKIIDCVKEKNPNVKIVINAIALNTVGEVMNIIEEKNLDADVVSLNVAKSKCVGGYQLMMGQNPVYIITLK